MNHMEKRQMDHMNHMAKEITWKRKSHGKRNHMTKRPIARERRKVKLVMAAPPAAPFTQSRLHLTSAVAVSCAELPTMPTLVRQSAWHLASASSSAPST